MDYGLKKIQNIEESGKEKVIQKPLLNNTFKNSNETLGHNTIIQKIEITTGFEEETLGLEATNLKPNKRKINEIAIEIQEVPSIIPETRKKNKAREDIHQQIYMCEIFRKKLRYAISFEIFRK
ncbi:hypothetical protein C2G38_2233378 [Gigaspora rosea]|uniref:Uncharacterized protein n=1 Tax=Gigaspora rosea TaxID=44941 RepID=A0A397TSC3_9GLOM|nr:hypothetical protein C2G38_2233378 [Gigaspora rosea]